MPVTTKLVSSNPAHGEVNSIQQYVIKSVNDLRPACGFLSTNKTARHYITEILSKMALTTITPNPYISTYILHAVSSNPVIIRTSTFFSVIAACISSILFVQLRPVNKFQYIVFCLSYLGETTVNINILTLQ